MPTPRLGSGKQLGDRREHPLSATPDFALDHEGSLGVGRGSLSGRAGWEPPGRTPTRTGRDAEGWMVLGCASAVRRPRSLRGDPWAMSAGVTPRWEGAMGQRG